MKKFILLSMILLISFIHMTAQTKLIPDYTGSTQYLIPEGWTVNTSQENGAYTWKAEARPGVESAPGVFVVAVPNQAGTDPGIVEQLLKQETPSLTLVERKDISNNEAHFLFTAEQNGKPANIVATFIRDPNQNLMFIAAFAAIAEDYQSLGKEALFYQMMKMNNPFSDNQPPALNNTPTSNGNVDVSSFNTQDDNLQNQLLRNTARIDAKQLVGQWLQAFSISTGESYQDAFSGSIQYGERGYGHLLRLNADGTYQITYSYNNFYQGCRNKVEMVEKGRYQLQGTTLTLNNATYNGFFNVCGKVTQENNKNGKIRQFRVGMDSSGNILVINGTPLEYSIGTEMDNAGNEYIQEGFKRVN